MIELSLAEVEHVAFLALLAFLAFLARLARLQLTGEEKRRMTRDLSVIREEFLNEAPESRDEYFVVPRVVDTGE